MLYIIIVCSNGSDSMEKIKNCMKYDTCKRCPQSRKCEEELEKEKENEEDKSKTK